MKIETTKKALKNSYSKFYYCGYCDLQNIFHNRSADHYTYGVYGWNFDAYAIGNGALITTGYRGMFGKRIPYELIKKYDKKARSILERHYKNYTCKRKALERNATNFINELNQGGL